MSGPSRDVIEHLLMAGVWRHLDNVRVMTRSNQVEAWISEAGMAQILWLAYGPCVRLRRGPWWLLHARLGKRLMDFRADNEVFGEGSLQIVVSRDAVPGKGHAFYADVDSDSPNMDLWHALKHLAEVVRNELAGEHGGPSESALTSGAGRSTLAAPQGANMEPQRGLLGIPTDEIKRVAAKAEETLQRADDAIDEIRHAASVAAGLLAVLTRVAQDVNAITAAIREKVAG